MREVKHLPADFFVGHIHYNKIDGVDYRWSLYSVYDTILDDKTFIAFRFRYSDAKQYRPAPGYESDKTWFLESDDIKHCYKWLKLNNLIEEYVTDNY